ncbi:MAG: hypothetical protein HDR39_05045 [Treponema sp.]|nr:hypothetical protein [Treponema sp.]
MAPTQRLQKSGIFGIAMRKRRAKQACPAVQCYPALFALISGDFAVRSDAEQFKNPADSGEIATAVFCTPGLNHGNKSA